ncbi:uncharacterized protein N7479_005097 [Penicillium vulpinum]|uniref:uncharacterized protein n=1 Tax=Penicillium vulpinum TaxID=29845 RepID=UPI0025476875|nr:uncharacterized protein N7479_005097 [Penicillium vulpinum]KAJ5965221.1 hypothetical protein N7479_005097 [Penicillium vulpinum]
MSTAKSPTLVRLPKLVLGDPFDPPDLDLQQGTENNTTRPLVRAIYRNLCTKGCALIETGH